MRIVKTFPASIREMNVMFFSGTMLEKHFFNILSRFSFTFACFTIFSDFSFAIFTRDTAILKGDLRGRVEGVCLIGRVQGDC